MSARRVLALALAATLPSMGCASTRYGAQVVAAQELTLAYDGGLMMNAGGQRVAESSAWGGLPEYVGCVPQAAEQARAARSDGVAGTTLSILGGSFGMLALGGFYGLADTDHELSWLGAGVASATLGLVLAAIGHGMRVSADGHAVDAMNYYNDAAGSLGGGCRAAPPMPPMPTPQLPGQAAPPSDALPQPPAPPSPGEPAPGDPAPPTR